MQFKIKENLIRIREEIAPYTPNIIAVTKYFDEIAIEEAYEAGLRDFGESRVIEAIEKIQKLPEEIQNNSKFHFIGHLQTNKVRKAVEHFDVIHSVDTLKVAEKISESATEIGKIQNIFLQLNNAGEVQKSGFSKEELFSDFEKISVLPNIKILGLMNMAPLGAPESLLRELFHGVRTMRDELEEKFNYKLPEMSMGMSQDYVIAAQEGATMLRIGRKLFS